MFESGDTSGARIATLAARLSELSTAPDARGMLEQVEELERLKSAAAAAQARITAAFDDRRRDSTRGTTRQKRALVPRSAWPGTTARIAVG